MNPVAHNYPSTILGFAARPPFEVDLRRAVSAAARARLRGLGLGARFGIVTPFNPGGRKTAAAANRLRLARLAGRLVTDEFAALAADGWSVDRRHRERGFAIAASRSELVALARDFGQSAIFWFDGRRFLLVWCDRPSRGVVLPARTL